MADFSKETVSVCELYLYIILYVLMCMCCCEHGFASMHAFSSHALSHTCEIVMWALKFNNFKGTICDRNLKSVHKFPQQPKKEEEKERRKGCTYPMLFEAISHLSQVLFLELSMQGLACVTGTSNLSTYCQSIILSSGMNAFILYLHDGRLGWSKLQKIGQQ